MSGGAFDHPILTYYSAFAMIQPGSFTLGLMNSYDAKFYQQMVSLKSKNPSLKVFISIGGWDAGGQIFSQMTSSSANRASFISSVLGLMQTYAFDGVDIDWEYPAAPDRGGVPADTANYVSLLRELRAAVGGQFQISATLPSSYWYLQGFDIIHMQSRTWDGTNPYTQAVVNPHTNLTEINQALDLLWRNSISPSKVVMGMGMYGRSFTLKNPSCNTPGCPFSSGGNPGPCTATSGILSNAEIQNIIAANNLSPSFDATAAVKWINWNSNQWVSYDDAQTYALKQNFANGKCLAGYMVWALDLDNSTSKFSTTSLVTSAFQDYQNKNPVPGLTITTNILNLGMYWTSCHYLTNIAGGQYFPGNVPTACAPGWQRIALGQGKTFDGDTVPNRGNTCSQSFNSFRELCAPVGSDQLAGCQWGFQGKMCGAICPQGTIMITKMSTLGGGRVACKAGTYIPLCCDSITEVGTVGSGCGPTPLEHNLSGGLSMGSDLTALIESLESGSGSVTRRQIGPRFLGRTGARNDSQLSKRWDLYESNGGSPICFGAGANYLPLGAIPIAVVGHLQPIQGPFPPQATVVPATSLGNVASNTVGATVTIIETSSTTTYATMPRVCDFNKYPQACAHYQSVGNVFPRYANPTCSRRGSLNPPRPLVASWDRAHFSVWSLTWITKSYVNPYGRNIPVSCQRDEWPPAHFQQGSPLGYVRLVPGGQNGGSANDGTGGWNGFCTFPAPSSIGTVAGPGSAMGPNWITTITIVETVTLKVMSYGFTNVPNTANDPYPYLLSQNPCYPSTLTNDPLYALLEYDPIINGRYNYQWIYDLPPPYALTNGKTPPTRRRVKRSEMRVEMPRDTYLFHDGDDFVVESVNSTRLATAEELRVHLGLAKCVDRDCAKENKQYADHLERILQKNERLTAASLPTASAIRSVEEGFAQAGAQVLGSPQPTRAPAFAPTKYKI